MYGYDIIIMVGLFFGMILYSVLLFEIMKRHNKLFHEYVFILFIIMLTCWHTFQFAAHVIRQIFGRSALEVYTEFRYLALYSIAFFPPLVVHLHASFLGYVRLLTNRTSRWHRWGPLVFYLPIVVIIYFSQYTVIDARKRILDENMSFIPYFIFWLVVCLWFSAALSFRIIQLSRNEKWKQFFIVESVIIIVITVLLLYFYFFGGTGNVRLDKSLRALLAISSLLPTGAMIYLLYKYPFFSIFARPGFLSVILAGSYLSVFIIGAKALRKWGDENPGLNVDILQVLMVCILFISYEPLKNLIRRFAGSRALSERYAAQTVLRKVSERIVGTNNLEDLTLIIRSTIMEVLKAESVGFYLLAKQADPDGTFYTITSQFGDIKPFNLKRVSRQVLQNKGLYEVRKIYMFHLSAAEIPYPLYVGIITESELTGLIAIGKKTNNDDYTYEEKELLITLANQVAIAVDNIESLQRRIELESRMMEAEKLSSLGLLATNIAHEVKNPLSSIKSIVQAMQDHPAHDAETRQDLIIITEEINRLSIVVDQLLKFSRPDHSELGLCDVARIVDTILSILRHETRRYQIQVFTDFPPQGLVLRTSAGNLKEIVFNLIINAIQSMAMSGGKLYISGHLTNLQPEDLSGEGVDYIDGVYLTDRLGSLEEERTFRLWSMEKLPVSSETNEGTKSEIPISQTDNAPGGLMRLIIRDTGQGMDSELMKNIFKPFYTTKVSGSGLGLAIVKNKIRMLHGHLVVRSREGSGSAFEIYIPYRQENA